MLVELGKVKELLGDALGRAARARLPSLVLVHAPEMGYLGLGYFELRGEVFDAVVHLLLLSANNADKTTVGASEDDGGTLVLVGKQLLVRQHFGASFVLVAAVEEDLAEQVSRHAVDSVELRLLSAVGTGVWVLLEPECFAVAAKRLFAVLALKRILKHVVADAANEFR